MRQYDSNPAYSYYNNGYYGPSRYFRNYYRTLPYRNYGGVSGPMGGGGGCPQPCKIMPVAQSTCTWGGSEPSFFPYSRYYNRASIPFISNTNFGSSPFGGFYNGRGNDWI
uniref:Spore coat protein n=1 Tax=Meloidogyne incognita TaxID=6306 RepID=A0A914LIB0_MELIC